MLDIQKIVQTLKVGLLCQDQTIALHEPHFGGNEWQYVKDCLDSGWVSSVGQYVNQFEKSLADYTGAKYAIATTNGTAALHIMFKLANIAPNDEVLMPSLTFVATANAIAYCQAIPHFVESEAISLGVDANKLENYLSDIASVQDRGTINRLTGRRIAALVVVHILGHPADLDALQAVCDRFRIPLLEDAAEGLGSFYKHRHVGHAGLMGTLSFNGNKIITTGGGGALLTDDPLLAKRAKHLTTTAKVPHAWRFSHDEIGYNYRLPNINAALGCAQLEQLECFLNQKRILAKTYERLFAKSSDFTLVKEPSYAKSNYWMNAILLSEENASERDVLLDQLISAKIGVRPLWDLQHVNAAFQGCPRMALPLAESLAKRLIQLPSSPQLISVKKLALTS